MPPSLYQNRVAGAPSGGLSTAQSSRHRRVALLLRQGLSIALLVRFLHLRDLGLEQFLREELHWRVPREEMVLAFREGAGGRIRRAIETADQS
jgi:hypothetical protein